MSAKMGQPSGEADEVILVRPLSPTPLGKDYEDGNPKYAAMRTMFSSSIRIAATRYFVCDPFE